MFAEEVYEVAQCDFKFYFLNFYLSKSVSHNILKLKAVEHELM